jgi:uncharacterized protein (DUF2267 family)
MRQQGLETIESTTQKTVPIKMSRLDFLAAIQEKIVAGRVSDPLETRRDVLSVVANHVGPGEMEKKVVHSFPQDMQPLFPALTAATP